jgi:hypothetical protein
MHLGRLRGKLFKRLQLPKALLLVAVALLVLSVCLAALSIYPVENGGKASSVLLDEHFHLSSLEMRRQGLGSFQGGENLTVQIEGDAGNPKNFSIITYSRTNFSTVFDSNVSYSFTAGADYYEAVFYAHPNSSSNIHLIVTMEKLVVDYPLSWLAGAAKVLFGASLSSLMLLMLRVAVQQNNVSSPKFSSLLGRVGRKRLLALLTLSLVVWLSLLAVNTNPLSSFEDWYTDHARHPYSATLFLQTGFSVFDKPLGQLSSADGSFYKFVTWPEMPHLYPIGSIFLFLPFGVLLQNGIDAVLVYKLEIALFLVFAHVCLYFFLKHFWNKELEVPLKLVGVYIIYVLLVIYAANGMFDVVPFLFSLLGLTLFLTKRYDYFILFTGVSIIFKYQAGIFLLPLIIYSLVALYHANRLTGLLRSKPVTAGAALALVSLSTALLSLPYLMQTRPQLIMNGINAFNSHSQIPWWLQSTAVMLTLTATLIYAAYMYRKNSLMSLSAVFLLLPSYMMPYIQNWYLPFLFSYILIPQGKKELAATMVWLVFMVGMLSFGGASFNPLLIYENFRTMLKL